MKSQLLGTIRTFSVQESFVHLQSTGRMYQSPSVMHFPSSSKGKSFKILSFSPQILQTLPIIQWHQMPVPRSPSTVRKHNTDPEPGKTMHPLFLDFVLSANLSIKHSYDKSIVCLYNNFYYIHGTCNYCLNLRLWHSHFTKRKSEPQVIKIVQRGCVKMFLSLYLNGVQTTSQNLKSCL